MKIEHVQQRSKDWYKSRHGKITGSQAHKQLLDTYTNRYEETLHEIKALEDTEEITPAKAKRLAAAKRRLDKEHVKFKQRKSGVDFWALVGAQFTDWNQVSKYYPGGSMQRGVDLEPVNIQRALHVLADWRGLDAEDADTEPGVWVNDMLGLQVSPDCCEKTPYGVPPKWAIECKSLATRTHVETLVKLEIVEELKRGELRDVSELVRDTFFPTLTADTPYFDLIPTDYQPQILSYFAANPYLETVYFSMLDDRLPEGLDFFMLPVERFTIYVQIGAFEGRIEETRNAVNALVDLLGNYTKGVYENGVASNRGAGE